MKYPYAEVELRSDGSPADPAQVTAALQMVRNTGATDVLVMVHGWNNDMPAARALYQRLAASMAAADRRTGALEERELAVIGILWPSIRWADDGQVAGGGVALDDAEAQLAAQIAEQVEDEQVRSRLLELVGQIETSSDARDQYVHVLRGLLPEPEAADEDPPPSGFTDDDPETVFQAARSAGGLTGHRRPEEPLVAVRSAARSPAVGCLGAGCPAAGERLAWDSEGSSTLHAIC